MNRFGARCSSNLRRNGAVEKDQENSASNTPRLGCWLLCDPLARRESSFESEPHDRAFSRDCSVEEVYVKTRREWEAYRLEVLPRVQHFKAVIEKYLVHKLSAQQIALTFRRWKRRSQIESSLGSSHALVASHRAYYLRKALVRTCWWYLARAFLKWQRFTKQSAVVLLRLSLSYEHQLGRLALGKWYHRVLLTERLEEETAARMWIRRQHQQTLVIQRKLRRSDKQSLVSYWINWRVAIRKCKCMLSDRRQRFQNRWMFTQWTRFVAHRKQDRELCRQPVRELVDELIESSVFQAQVKQAWAAKAQKLQVAVQVIERVAAAHQRQAVKQTCFRTWRAAAAVAMSPDSRSQIPAVEPPKEIRRVRLPEKISALYRSRARRGGAPGVNREKHRPQWR